MNSDVIIIGASVSGLIAGINILKQGKDVLILEKNGFAGGLYSSNKVGRYNFSMFNGVSSDINSNMFFSDILKKIDVESFNGYKQEALFRVIGYNSKNDKVDVLLPFGIDSFIDKLGNLTSCNGIRDFFNIAIECRDAINFIISNNGVINDEVLKIRYSNYVKFSNYTLNQMFDYLKIPIVIRDVLSSMWINIGTPIEKLSFIHYSIYILNYIEYGSFVITDDIVAKLLSIYTKLGGIIHYNCLVDKIFVENNVVSGVNVYGGNVIHCNHIISSLGLKRTYGQLVDNVPISAKKMCNRLINGNRKFSVAIGLNRSLKQMGLNDCIYNIYDSLNSNVSYDLMKVMGAESIIVNGFNDEEKGYSSLLIETNINSDVFEKTINAERYIDFINFMANKMIETFVYNTGINIERYIEEIKIYSPVDYYNNSGDVVVNFNYEGNNGLLARLLNKKNENYVKGLRFCGKFDIYGNSLEGIIVSGYQCGELTIKDMVGDYYGF